MSCARAGAPPEPPAGARPAFWRRTTHTTAYGHITRQNWRAGGTSRLRSLRWRRAGGTSRLRSLRWRRAGGTSRLRSLRWRRAGGDFAAAFSSVAAGGRDFAAAPSSVVAGGRDFAAAPSSVVAGGWGLRGCALFGGGVVSSSSSVSFGAPHHITAPNFSRQNRNFPYK